MGKKFSAIILAICSVAGIAALAKYCESYGIFKKLPEASYLTEEEEAYRPAYRQLSDKEKAVYEALYRGISDKKEFILLPYEIDGDTYSRVYCMLEKQEGKFFYLGSSYYTADKLREAQIVYRDGIDRADEKIAELENAEKEAVSYVDNYSGDYEKVMAINDYIVKNCEYVSGADVEYSPTAYGCLVEKAANCEGYAKAFDMIAADAGIESQLITGITDKGENHAWNQVKVDGEWYNIDVTWADTDDGDEVRRAYFLCDDADFLKTHTADDKYIKPMKCDSQKHNYYIKNDLYVESLDDAEDAILEKVNAGEDVVELKFADDSLYADFKQKFIKDQYIFQLPTDNGRAFESDMTVSITEGEGDRCITLFLS
ncbi:MAG: hypothetical protein KBA55_13665 [Ruminococcus sp.]|nr:hypothetical protein [Ruminococcus sp.]